MVWRKGYWEMNCRANMVAVLACLLVVGGMESSYAYEEYVWGGEEHPWQEDGEFFQIAMDSVNLQPLNIDTTMNLVTGFQDRGGFELLRGWGQTWRGGQSNPVFDGDSTTALEQQFEVRFAGRASDWIPTLDLGVPYPVDRIVFYTREGYEDRYVDRYRLHISNELAPNGYPIWTLISEEQENTEPVVDIRFPLRQMQFLTIRPWQNRLWEIAELEIYGRGYAPDATYESEIIDFEEIASWGNIRWQGERDEYAKIFIQTRTGTDEDPNIYWRKTGRGDEITNLREDGKLLTAKDYKNLPKTEQAGTTYDTENWSFWSAPYDFEAGMAGEDGSGEGVPVVSPGPRRYFQLKVIFRSTATDASRIDWLGFELSSPPAADAVVAEVWPLEVEPATSSQFVYSMSPTIRGTNTGFNSLEIFTAVKPDGVDFVKIDDRDVDLGAYAPEILSDRLAVHFPMMGEGESGSLVEVGFRSVVLRYGTEFSGWVYDSESEEVYQLVGSGDASDRYDGDELSVRMSLGESLIRSVELSGEVFSPNGDGINDALEIRFDVLKLTGDVPIEVGVYDLGGRKVREVYRELGRNGKYEVAWDGMDGEGKVVLPGMYVYRISVESDMEDKVHSAAIAVVY